MDELGVERVHLQVRAIPRSSIGLAQVSLRAVRSGLLLPAAAIALFIFLLLVLGRSRISMVSTEAGAALLLLGPTLLAALVARPGEHPLTTRLLLGVRVLVVVSGVTSFTAAAALAAKYSGHDLEVIWESATMASGFCAAVLLFSFLWRPGDLVPRAFGTAVRRALRFARRLSRYWAT